MSITGLHTVPNYEELLKNLIKNSEGLETQIYLDSVGVVTIGYGYSLEKNPSTILNDFSNAGIYLSDNQKIKIKELFGEDKKPTKSQIDAFNISSDSITITKEQASELFLTIKDRYERQASAILGSNNKNTKEYIVLVDMAYNGILEVSPSFKKAIETGNRAAAWYELRYNSNSGDSYITSGVGIAKRRIEQSKMFGLYSTAPTEEEYKSVMKMYTIYKDKINEVENESYIPTLNNSTIGSAYTNHKAINEIEKAKQYLMGTYAFGYSIDGEVIVGIDSVSDQISSGSTIGDINDTLVGTLNNDLIFGERGNDNIISADGDDIIYGGKGDDILEGGKGGDIYVYNIGDGVDKIIESNGFDWLVLENVNSFDVQLVSDENDLIIEINSDDKIIIENFLSLPSNAIEVVKFKDSSYIINKDLTLTPFQYMSSDLKIYDLNQLIHMAKTSDIFLENIIFSEAPKLQENSNEFTQKLSDKEIEDRVTNYYNKVNNIESDTLYTELGLRNNNVDAKSVVIFADEKNNAIYETTINRFRNEDTTNITIYTGSGNDKIYLEGNYEEDKENIFRISSNRYLDYEVYRDFEIYRKNIYSLDYVQEDLLSELYLSRYTKPYYDNEEMQEFFLGDGNDIVSGSYIQDIIWGENGNDKLYGNDGDDIISGGNGNDIIVGGNGSDSLSGGSGNDTIYSGHIDSPFAGYKHYESYEFSRGGKNIIRTGLGMDTVYGGNKFDIVTYSHLNHGINIDLNDSSFQYINNSSRDKLININGIIGTTSDDIVRGRNDGKHIYWGSGYTGDFFSNLGGNDTFYGNGGNDTIVYSGGHLTISEPATTFEFLDEDLPFVRRYKESFGEDKILISHHENIQRYYIYINLDIDFEDMIVTESTYNIEVSFGNSDKITFLEGIEWLKELQGSLKLSFKDGSSAFLTYNNGIESVFVYGDNGDILKIIYEDKKTTPESLTYNEDENIISGRISESPDYKYYQIPDEISIDGFKVDSSGYFKLDTSHIRYQSLKEGEVLNLRIPIIVERESFYTSELKPHKFFSYIYIEGKNDAPTANTDNIIAFENSHNIIDILSNDVDIDGDEISLNKIISSPEYGELTINDDRTLTYLSKGNFSGEDSFEYQIEDEWGEISTAVVNISVLSLDDAPILTYDSEISVNENSNILIGSINKESKNFTYTTRSDVDGFTLNSDGKYKFDASHSSYQSLKKGEVKVLTIIIDVNKNTNTSYTSRASSIKSTRSLITNHKSENIEILTINLIGTNDIPIAKVDNVEIDEDSSIDINVLANDMDIDNDTLNIDSVLINPENGIVNINENGTIKYIPNEGYHGSDSFTYQINDGNGGQSSAKVNILVAKTNISPIANNDIELEGVVEKLGEIKVNNEKGLDRETHENQKVLSFTDGSYIILWETTTKNKQGYWNTWNNLIYSQRFDSRGNTLGNIEIVKETGSNPIYRPDIISINENEYMIFWEMNTGIYAQKYDSNGKVGHEILVKKDDSSIQLSKLDVSAKDDGYLVSFIEMKSKQYIVQQYNNMGELQIENNIQLKSSYGSGSITNLENGNYVLVWEDDEPDVNDNYHRPNIYSQLFDEDGNKLGNLQEVNTYTSNNQKDPAISSLSDGYIITWISSYQQSGDPSGIYFQQFDNSGTKVNNETFVSAGLTGYDYDPSVATLNDDSFIIAWKTREIDSSYSIYTQKYNINGENIGNRILVRKSDYYDSNISIDTLDDGFIISWKDGAGFRDYNSEIYYKRYNNDGTEWSRGIDISTYEHEEVIIDVLSNDIDLDGDILSIESLESTVYVDGVEVGVSEVVEVNGKQQIKFTPGNELSKLSKDEEKVVSFNYTVSDGNGGSDTAIVLVKVIGTDDVVSFNKYSRNSNLNSNYLNKNDMDIIIQDMNSYGTDISLDVNLGENIRKEQQLMNIVTSSW